MSIYIDRTLYNSDNQEIKESELISLSQKVIIILAEPGAGKSCLLDNIAKQLGVQKKTANLFIHLPPERAKLLIIDAFDELVRIDSSSVTKSLVMAENTSAEKIILSSRSSEWSESYTRTCKELFGEDPLLLYLKPFNQQEQKEIFNSYYPEENAETFLQEAGKIELAPLLSNPLFLILFSKSYIENNKIFENRYSAFKIAIEGLARENNPSHSSSLPANKKVELVEDVFCKLILSGSEGISTSDRSSQHLFPNITNLNSDTNIFQILSTQFFTPGENPGQHRPIHKIVVEYCVGRYLANKLTSSVNPLSLNKILSIIAPNNIVRDELRGLFAWIAVLSENQQIQEKLINLDPYAILANGDPSLLLPRSKRILLSRLKDLNQKDPYFTRHDMWRNFSISDFFYDDMIDELKELLSEKYRSGNLQRVLLKLLLESPLVSKVVDELRTIICDTNPKYKELSIRRLAGECLLKVKGYPIKDVWIQLVSEKDSVSLSIASEIMNLSDRNYFDLNDYIYFLNICAELYPTSYEIERVLGKRYFIRLFIQELELDLTIKLLDSLSNNLACTCQKKYDCECRVGISKIIGMLLDRYFELSSKFNMSKIWEWIKNLYFQNGISKEQSLSVKTLSENDELRQGIIKLAFENLWVREEIHNMKCYHFEWHSHSGLNFQYQDLRFIIDLAFETNNIELWKYFIARHDFYNKEKKPNLLRRYMRNQALQKPAFLIAWYRINQESKEFYQRNTLKYNRKKSIRNINRKKRKSLARNIQYIQQNRELIESGSHWDSLLSFSYTFLQEPGKIAEKFGDEKLVRNALYNCINYIQSDIPNLTDLAKLHSDASVLNIEIVLYASCIEIFTRDRSLKTLQQNLLEALYTHLSVPWIGMDDCLRKQLKDEVESLLFNNVETIEKFISDYIEPQLPNTNYKNHPVYWLEKDLFKQFQKKYALEWLSKYSHLKLPELEKLMSMAIQSSNRESLKLLVKKRCDELVSAENHKQNGDQKTQRDFWYIHAFYLLDQDYEDYWKELTKDRNAIFILENDLRVFGDYKDWLVLSPEKVELILNTFWQEYPEVELSDIYGSESPDDEKAYRFLTNVIFFLGKNESDNTIPVIDRLLNNPAYINLHSDLRSIRFNYLKKIAIQSFQAPKPEQIVNLIERDEIISMENLRAVIIEEFQHYQDDLNGHDITTKSIFYNGDMVLANRVDENTATQYIAERLRRLENRQIIVSREHYMKDDKRCDIVISKLIEGNRKIVPIEVKGQWHSEVYSAFENQLNRLYSIHPDSDGQGIYLVLWFGSDEKVAGVKGHGINSAQELYWKVYEKISEELRNRIDLFVLDLSS